MTTTARTVTLTAAQVRAVILGLGTTDQDHRTHAAGVVVDALLAAPAAEPVEAAAGLDNARREGALDAERRLRQLDAEAHGRYADLRDALRHALGPWHADDRPVPDVALVEYVTDAVRAAERGRAPVDDERGRRVGHVVEAAEVLVSYDRNNAAPRAWRELGEAVEALREYTPAEVAAPADTEPAPAVGPTVRGELHDLAPLPWRHYDRGAVNDARGVNVVDVNGMDTVAADERVAELLVALVNAAPTGGTA